MVSRLGIAGIEISQDPPARLGLRDRLIVLAGLIGVVAVSWYYLATFDMGMAPTGMEMSSGEMAAPAMPMASMSFSLLAAMWIVMMIGMMLPSAIPMILMATRMSRSRRDSGGPGFATGSFTIGYVLAWTGFSLVAAAAQLGLQEGIVAGHEMAIRIAPIAGAVLITAGIYQWTPFKDICLAKCRSPFGFFLSHWRPGALGALRMGLHHGLFCIGCCWMLMALLFVTGVMALPWVGALSALVLVEKIAPKGEWIARAGGAAMVAGGIYVIVSG